MNPSLTFRIKPARSSELIMGELCISGLGPNRIVYDATSGIAGYQKPGNSWTRGKGLIPPSNVITAPYSVETTPIHPTNPAAAGEWQYRILPDEVWENIAVTVPGSTDTFIPTGWQPQRRTLLRIHFDENHATSPGSAGCIVLTDREQWESFMANMKAVDELLANSCCERVVTLEVAHA